MAHSTLLSSPYPVITSHRLYLIMIAILYTQAPESEEG